MPRHMIQLATSRMSLCLVAKFQLCVIHGSGWQIIMTTFPQSKCTWVNQQHELILAANRWALKRMRLSAEKSVSRAGGKALSILIGSFGVTS